MLSLPGCPGSLVRGAVPLLRNRRLTFPAPYGMVVQKMRREAALEADP
jgi:hypothetical protein